VTTLRLHAAILLLGSTLASGCGGAGDSIRVRSTALPVGTSWTETADHDASIGWRIVGNDGRVEERVVRLHVHFEGDCVVVDGSDGAYEVDVRALEATTDGVMEELSFDGLRVRSTPAELVVSENWITPVAGTLNDATRTRLVIMRTNARPMYLPPTHLDGGGHHDWTLDRGDAAAWMSSMHLLVSPDDITATDGTFGPVVQQQGVDVRRLSSRATAAGFDDVAALEPGRTLESSEASMEWSAMVPLDHSLPVLEEHEHFASTVVVRSGPDAMSFIMETSTVRVRALSSGTH